MQIAMVPQWLTPFVPRAKIFRTYRKGWRYEGRAMIEQLVITSTEGRGVGYGTRRQSHPPCHKTSIGCDPFMSKVFNE